MLSSVFVYGTLMSPDVLRILLGRVPQITGPALVHGFQRHPVIGHVFPGMIPTTEGGGQTEGLILLGISCKEMQILDWFEGDEYSRQSVNNVELLGNDDRGEETQQQMKTVQSYIWNSALEELDLEKEWDFQQFCLTKLEWYLANTVRPCRLEMDELMRIGKT